MQSTIAVCRKATINISGAKLSVFPHKSSQFLISRFINEADEYQVIKSQLNYPEARFVFMATQLIYTKMATRLTIAQQRSSLPKFYCNACDDQENTEQYHIEFPETINAELLGTIVTLLNENALITKDEGKQLYSQFNEQVLAKIPKKNIRSQLGIFDKERTTRSELNDPESRLNSSI